MAAEDDLSELKALIANQDARMEARFSELKVLTEKTQVNTLRWTIGTLLRQKRKAAGELGLPGQSLGAVAAQDVDACTTLTPLLLVGSPHAFAGRLLSMGARKFIIRPFHFRQTQDRNRLMAQTREPAFVLMAVRLDCPKSDFQERYLSGTLSAGALSLAGNPTPSPFSPALTPSRLSP